MGSTPLPVLMVMPSFLPAVLPLVPLLKDFFLPLSSLSQTPTLIFFKITFLMFECIHVACTFRFPQPQRPGRHGDLESQVIVSHPTSPVYKGSNAS